jgi:protein phosphatase 1A
MALLCPRAPRLPPSIVCCVRGARCHATAAGGVAAAGRLGAIRWGSAKLQGRRDEMEDEIVLRPGALLDGFSFAAVLDGHAGFSAVRFLRHAPIPGFLILFFHALIQLPPPLYSPAWRCRDELYKECAAALDGGAVLSTKNLEAITASIQRAFVAVDAKLTTWSVSVLYSKFNLHS